MGGRGSYSGKNNQIIRESSDNFGSAGTYEVFRSGDLSAPNGMIFFSTSFGEASNYGKSHGDSPNKDIDTYHIKINNPLVVTGSTDVEMLRNAWEKLHPGKQYPKGPIDSKKWQKADKQNAKALLDSPYDAIIYLKPKGRHEIMIPKKQADKQLNKVKTTKHSGKFYNYKDEWV